MKHFLLIIILIVCQNAIANDYITVFKVGNQVCTPIVIKSSAGEYTLTTELRIPTSLSWFEAFDCQGRKIMETESTVSIKTGETTVRTYVLNTLFPTTNNQSEIEESVYDDGYSSDHNYSDVPKEDSSDYTQKAANWLSKTSERKGWNIYNNIVTIDAGYGYPYGGLGIRARYISPCVVGISAAFGYNTHIRNILITTRKSIGMLEFSFILTSSLLLHYMVVHNILRILKKPISELEHLLKAPIISISLSALLVV